MNFNYYYLVHHRLRLFGLVCLLIVLEDFFQNCLGVQVLYYFKCNFAIIINSINYFHYHHLYFIMVIFYFIRSLMNVSYFYRVNFYCLIHYLRLKILYHRKHYHYFNLNFIPTIYFCLIIDHFIANFLFQVMDRNHLVVLNYSSLLLSNS